MRDLKPQGCHESRRSSRHRLNRVVQVILGILVIMMCFLACATIVRSIHTSRLNDSLSKIHSSPEPDAKKPEAGDLTTDSESVPSTILTPSIAAGEPALMGNPDGSPLALPAVSSEAATAKNTAAFHQVGTIDTILPDMLELKRINRDTVGWISIANVLDLPVVYRDNAWYLDHGFDGQKNAAGTLFLDQFHPLNSETQNLLIHGHNMKDGSMFAMLTHYQSQDFFQAHQLLSFSTLWEKETYLVFAVLRVSSRAGDTSYFDYLTHPVFSSEQDFTAYIQELIRRSLHHADLQVSPSDALLTLSTCIGDDRLVVVAKRIISTSAFAVSR